MSDEHFTVDGTLIEAWASQKSLQRKDQDPAGPGPPRVPRAGATRRHPCLSYGSRRQAVSTAPHGEARLAFLGHVLIANRSGLVVDAMATQADGTAERDAAMLLLESQWLFTAGRRRTVGADKGYDTRDFVAVLRDLGVTLMSPRTRRGPGQRHRRWHHPACGVSAESSRAPAHRTSVRLAQDDRRTPQG